MFVRSLRPRRVSGVKNSDSDLFVVHLQPLTDLEIAERFLLWHIEQYQYQHPALRELRKNIRPHIKWMIDRTDGIPLLMQLVLSDAAHYSWDYVEMLPSLFGEALLNFLYQARWNDLGSQNQEGEGGQITPKVDCPGTISRAAYNLKTNIGLGKKLQYRDASLRRVVVIV